jgi:hypothetical protein
MQIGGISPISQTANVLNPTLVGRSSAGSQSGVAALPALAKSSTGTTSSPTAPASAAAAAKSSHAHAAQAQSGGSSAEVNSLITGYSTTVAGTQYSGSVQEAGGEYTASVPNLARATASGSSIQAAENNLYVRIDELV